MMCGLQINPVQSMQEGVLQMVAGLNKPYKPMHQVKVRPLPLLAKHDNTTTTF